MVSLEGVRATGGDVSRRRDLEIGRRERGGTGCAVVVGDEGRDESCEGAAAGCAIEAMRGLVDAIVCCFGS